MLCIEAAEKIRDLREFGRHAETLFFVARQEQSADPIRRSRYEILFNCRDQIELGSIYVALLRLSKARPRGPELSGKSVVVGDAWRGITEG